MKYNKHTSSSFYFICPIKEDFLNNGLIVLLDSDTAYSSCLCEYINIHTSLDYETMTFSQIDVFLDFSVNKQIDILLVNEDIFSSLPLYKISFLNLFILSETNFDSTIEKDSYTFNVFFKYQSMQGLLHKIMSHFSLDRHNYAAFAINHTSKLIGVYSPIKRCGKTSFAIALATAYSGKTPTLFITFDEYACDYLSMSKDKKTISELMFYLLDNSSNTINHLDSIVCTINGLDIIPPAIYPDDLRHLASDTLISFLSQLKNTKYTHIIIDFANTLFDIVPLLNLCDKVYMPVVDDDISRKKLSDFLVSAKNICTDFSEDIFTLITPPVFSYTDGNTSIYNQLMLSPLLSYITSNIIGDKYD